MSKKPMDSEAFAEKEDVVIRPQYPVPLEEHMPIVVGVEEFQYTYRCKHCGHLWLSELHEEQKGGLAPKGYTGD